MPEVFDVAYFILRARLYRRLIDRKPYVDAYLCLPKKISNAKLSYTMFLIIILITFTKTHYIVKLLYKYLHYILFPEFYTLISKIEPYVLLKVLC